MPVRHAGYRCLQSIAPESRFVNPIVCKSVSNPLYAQATSAGPFPYRILQVGRCSQLTDLLAVGDDAGVGKTIADTPFGTQYDHRIQQGQGNHKQSSEKPD